MIYSFSYIALGKGLIELPDGIRVFDARIIEDPAPLFSDRGVDGRHWAVMQFVHGQPKASKLYDEAMSYLDTLYPGDNIAIGCAGGIYRSVAMAEWISFVDCQSVKHLGLELFHSGVHVWEL